MRDIPVPSPLGHALVSIRTDMTAAPISARPFSAVAETSHVESRPLMVKGVFVLDDPGATPLSSQTETDAAWTHGTIAANSAETAMNPLIFFFMSFLLFLFYTEQAPRLSLISTRSDAFRPNKPHPQVPFPVSNHWNSFHESSSVFPMVGNPVMSD
jgi:hypothetical protein